MKKMTHKTLFDNIFYARYGCTKIIISDQGREFVNKLNQILFKKLGTEQRISTAYHRFGRKIQPNSSAFTSQVSKRTAK